MTDAASKTHQRVRFADLELDPKRRIVSRGGRTIELTGKSYDLLAALVDAAPDTLSYDELMDAVWRGAVVSQATVSKRIELLRNALSDDSADPRYIALDRGRGYRLLPPVEDLSATPLALSATRTPRWPMLAGLGALALIAVVLAIASRPRSSPELPEQSIAVLPFEALSGSLEDQRFADGLADELNHVLASELRLQVAGRTSAFQFRDRSVSPEQIGAALGVAHLLDGSVQRSGEKLRITAQLISTKDGLSLWSATYDRELADIFDIQSDIAQNVALELMGQIGVPPRLATIDAAVIDPETYATYLRAASLSPYGQGFELAEAQTLIEEVTERAPGFAPGWNRLAAIHGRRLLSGDPDYDRTPEQSMGIVMSAVARAVAIAPENAETYANIGGAAWVFEGDVRKAAPYVERAVATDPYDLDLIAFAVDFAKYIGRMEEALPLEEQIVAQDPLCYPCRARLAESYLFLGALDEALTQYRTLAALGEPRHWGHGVVLLLEGQAEEALNVFRQLENAPWQRLQGEVLVRCATQGRVGAESDLARLRNEAPVHTAAQALAFCGLHDAALDLLEASLPAETVAFQFTYLSPLFDGLRSDRRWDALLRQVGLSDEQIRSIPFSLEVARAALR